MGFDLHNSKGDYLRRSPTGWALALNLAERYGWKPAGTSLHAGSDQASEDWDGQYDTNDGQQVTEADSVALASALRNAVDDPQFPSQMRRLYSDLLGIPVRTGFLKLRWSLPLSEVNKLRDAMAEVAAFCEQGAFIIE